MSPTGAIRIELLITNTNVHKSSIKMASSCDLIKIFARIKDNLVEENSPGPSDAQRSPSLNRTILS